jgi:hypothetical protein
MTNAELMGAVNTINTKTSNLTLAEGTFKGVQASVTLPNQANTMITIGNTKYTSFRLDVIIGNLASSSGKFGAFYIFNNNNTSIVSKSIAVDSNIVVGTDMIFENSGSDIVIKFPSATTGVSCVITKMSVGYNTTITTGTYT